MHQIARLHVVQGSPPHVRGKVCTFWPHQRPSRITPACAGKSAAAFLRITLDKDHPRMCGEKCLSGKKLTGVGRITPACAGKSGLAAAQKLLNQDHPRMCGEKVKRGYRGETPVGSPPHVRGKGAAAGGGTQAFRITPACAGKRLKRSRSIVPHAAIVPLFPSVCKKPAGSDGSPAGHDAPPFLPIENAAPASPAYNLRSL